MTWDHIKILGRKIPTSTVFNNGSIYPDLINLNQTFNKLNIVFTNWQIRDPNLKDQGDKEWTHGHPFNKFENYRIIRLDISSLLLP